MPGKTKSGISSHRNNSEDEGSCAAHKSIIDLIDRLKLVNCNFYWTQLDLTDISN